MGPCGGVKHIRDENARKDGRGLDHQHCEASVTALCRVALELPQRKMYSVLFKPTVILGLGENIPISVLINKIKANQRKVELRDGESGTESFNTVCSLGSSHV